MPHLLAARLVCSEPRALMPLTPMVSRLRRRLTRARVQARDEQRDNGSEATSDNRLEQMELDTAAIPQNFCIIESRTTVQNFAALGVEELQEGINVRRNRIFLLMEEVRRMRIQQRLKTGGAFEEDVSKREYSSATDESIRDYYIAFTIFVVFAVGFGGVIAPYAELKLGLGGTTYAEFIHNMGLPEQLGQVDPIVASFTGGAVGVLSTLLVVEVNNVEENAKKRCVYCSGTGYLRCAQCASKGRLVSREGVQTFCPSCSGSGKVMCTSCLCTGLALATEHDPRIDPFD